jgi:RNA polymerase sigma-70 factor (ECF subfamily)
MGEELEHQLRKALDSLPPMYREVYELHDIRELSAKEVGRHLGLTLAAVKSRLHRAREMIRQRLDHAVHDTGSSARGHDTIA